MKSLISVILVVLAVLAGVHILMHFVHRCRASGAAPAVTAQPATTGVTTGATTTTGPVAAAIGRAAAGVCPITRPSASSMKPASESSAFYSPFNGQSDTASVTPIAADGTTAAAPTAASVSSVLYSPFNDTPRTAAGILDMHRKKASGILDMQKKKATASGNIIDRRRKAGLDLHSAGVAKAQGVDLYGRRRATGVELKNRRRATADDGTLSGADLKAIVADEVANASMTVDTNLEGKSAAEQAAMQARDVMNVVDNTTRVLFDGEQSVYNVHEITPDQSSHAMMEEYSIATRKPGGNSSLYALIMAAPQSSRPNNQHVLEVSQRYLTSQTRTDLVDLEPRGLARVVIQNGDEDLAMAGKPAETIEDVMSRELQPPNCAPLRQP